MIHLAAKFQIPKIYPITDTRISGMSHVEQVKKLISGGAGIIQLRDKLASSFAFYTAARESVEIARRSGVLIIINDRVDIAMAAGANGVHLGQDDLPADEARRLLGEDAVIGLSTHSVSQAAHAVTLPIDYVAVGPIFPTGTKERAEPVIGTEMLQSVRAANESANIVAIGGISEQNVVDVFDSGADSVAMVGAILENPSAIEEKMRIFNSLSQPHV